MYIFIEFSLFLCKKYQKRPISLRMSSFMKKSGYDFSQVICALEGGSNMTEDVD